MTDIQTKATETNYDVGSSSSPKHPLERFPKLTYDELEEKCRRLKAQLESATARLNLYDFRMRQIDEWRWEESERRRDEWRRTGKVTVHSVYYPEGVLMTVDV